MLLKSEKFEKQNAWVSLLRLFVCFVVIQIHCPPDGTTFMQKVIYFFSWYAVPCFMFLSFYFLADDLLELKKAKIKARLAKLYVPIFFWTIVYYIVSLITWGICKEPLNENRFRGFLAALVGISRNDFTSVFWFLVVQIVILVFITVIFQFLESKNEKIVALILMLLIPYVFQYLMIHEGQTGFVQGGINCLPFAASGVLYRWILEKRSKWIRWLAFVCFLILTFANIRYIPQSVGTFYCSPLLMTASNAMCIFALNLPDVFNKKSKMVINWLGSYTLGIYCLHLIISQFLYKFLGGILWQGTLWFDWIVFGICFLITMIIKLINAKVRVKWLSYVV